MSGFFRRLAGIPWRSFAGEAASRAVLVAKAFCVVHVINHHVCELSFVRGPSMLPAMNLAGDVVAVDKVSVRLGKVGPGDVVLLISPEDPLKLVAKRVHGLEGETVSYFVDPGNSSASKTVVVSCDFDRMGLALIVLTTKLCVLVSIGSESMLLVL